MNNQYLIKSNLELPQIVFCIYENNELQSELIVDISQNYQSIPLDVLNNYSQELRQKFIEIINLIAEEDNLERAYNSRSALISNIVFLKSRIDEYIQTQEPNK